MLLLAGCSPNEEGFTTSLAALSEDRLLALQRFDASSQGGSSDAIRLVELDDRGKIVTDFTDALLEECAAISTHAELQPYQGRLLIKDICGKGTEGVFAPLGTYYADVEQAALHFFGYLQYKEEDANCGRLVLDRGANQIDLFAAPEFTAASAIRASDCVNGDLSVDYPRLVAADSFFLTLKLRLNDRSEFRTEVCHIELGADAIACVNISSEFVPRNSLTVSMEDGTRAVLMPFSPSAEVKGTELLILDEHLNSFRLMVDECIRSIGFSPISDSLVGVACDGSILDIPLTR